MNDTPRPRQDPTPRPACTCGINDQPFAQVHALDCAVTLYNRAVLDGTIPLPPPRTRCNCTGAVVNGVITHTTECAITQANRVESYRRPRTPDPRAILAELIEGLGDPYSPTEVADARDRATAALAEQPRPHIPADAERVSCTCLGMPHNLGCPLHFQNRPVPSADAERVACTCSAAKPHIMHNGAQLGLTPGITHYYKGVGVAPVEVSDDPALDATLAWLEAPNYRPRPTDPLVIANGLEVALRGTLDNLDALIAGRLDYGLMIVRDVRAISNDARLALEAITGKPSR